MTDSVNHPKHYVSHRSGIECIDLVEKLSFNLGNAIKYIWRHEEKQNPIQDLEKAVWYFQREQASLSGIGLPTRTTKKLLSTFLEYKDDSVLCSIIHELDNYVSSPWILYETMLRNCERILTEHLRTIK